MAPVPTIVPISDLRQDATRVVQRVSSSKEPVFITQRGRAAAVLVSMEAYQEVQQELEMLRLLARGEKEVEAGEGFDMDEVFAEADKVIEESKS